MKSKNKIILIIIFAFTTFSGAIRKWLIDSIAVSNIILGLQLLIPYLLLFFKLNTSPFEKNKRIILIYALLLVVLALNPLNKTLFHSVFGFILHFGFWFSIFYYLRDRESFELEKLLNFFILISLIQIALSYVQYSLPPSHFLNKYALTKQDIGTIASVGDAVRVTGTFSYLSGFAAFMVFYGFLLWTMFKLNYSLSILVTMIFLGLISAMMSGARACMLFYILIVCCSILDYGNKQTLVKSLLKGAFSILVLLLVFVVVGDQFDLVGKFQKSYENFALRVKATQETGEQNSRIAGPLTGVVNFKGEHSLFGTGIGGTYQGATAIWGTSLSVKEFGYYEDEGERIILEGGYLLYFTRILLYILLISQLRINKILLSVLSLFMILYLPLVFDIYNSVYLFLGLALLDRACMISEKRELQQINSLFGNKIGNTGD